MLSSGHKRVADKRSLENLYGFKAHVLSFLNRYSRLRFEDLVEDPLSALVKVFSDLGLAFDKRHLNAFYSNSKVINKLYKDALEQCNAEIVN